MEKTPRKLNHFNSIIYYHVNYDDTYNGIKLFKLRFNKMCIILEFLLVDSPGTNAAR